MEQSEMQKKRIKKYNSQLAQSIFENWELWEITIGLWTSSRDF